ncbi:MAG: thymidine phosphorylase [Clostridia bacterium]|nr:thymidine phosphorylase [Clostridia bacterium]
MRMYDIILKKRNGDRLFDEEIGYFVDGYTRGDIPDYQAAALCMAICLQGMDDDEIAALTYSMARSGDMLDLSRFGNLSSDKHSTGGVGDKTSLIVGPIAAALGAKVTKMSGRGLGHTGGTVDKLEAIPGMRMTISREEFLDQCDRVGLAIIGQSGNMTPADKKLYALRDVTATVDSIPLITSSIMSKKLAAGAHNIVLDVKTGSGAFMKTYEASKQLAESMVKIGKLCGRNMAALITDMDRPLGYAVGNALEIIEAVEVLKGQRKGDLYEVCIALASEMVMLFKGIGQEEARAQAVGAIESGAAFDKMKEWIAAQGGDVRCLEDTRRFADVHPIRHVVPIVSPTDGYITAMDAAEIGTAAMILGAGRSTKEDPIDYGAGLTIAAKTGDKVEQGATLGYLYTNNEEAIPAAAERYIGALTFGREAPQKVELIQGVVR